jgi:AraC-like DNA-binding protein
MDSPVKNMDSFVKHWAAFPRRFSSLCPLRSVGEMRGKDHWVRQRFSTCNFSFILRGRGEFHRKGRVWKVQAPFVITQWPGDMVEYGPPVPHETWDELYLIYDARCMPSFRRGGFVDESRPVWPIQNLPRVMEQVEELRALNPSRPSEIAADRADRIAERLVLESLLPGPRANPETDDELIQHLLLRFRARPDEAHDFDHLARQHGLSPSTLRRRWVEVVKVTPGRYLLNLRIQKARRLLAETPLQVGEIAAQTGFEDMLYFSRRFKIETRLTPSEYRSRYRIRPSRETLRRAGKSHREKR